MPFVARLKNQSAVLLLAESGLLERGTNVAFEPSGKPARFAYARFESDSEREIELDSEELTAEQRRAYSAHWKYTDRAEDLRRTLEALRASASQHPFRQDAERFGGAFLAKGDHQWAETIEQLALWLRMATEEDVIGNIGTYAGSAWLTTTVTGLDGREIQVKINADTRAVGVASFLAFIAKCGGPERVRGTLKDGILTLESEDRTEVFSAQYFYLYPL